MSYSTVDACMIIDLDGGGLFKFQFMPESITDSKSATYHEYDLMGRSSPLRGYMHGPSRTLEFTVVMFANPTADGPGMSTGSIKMKTDFLLSLPYPDYAGGLKPPHNCMVIIGGSIVMQGVCTSASATYKRPTPWDLGPGLTHGVEISLRFEENKDEPLDVWDRRGGAG